MEKLVPGNATGTKKARESRRLVSQNGPRNAKELKKWFRLSMFFFFDTHLGATLEHFGFQKGSQNRIKPMKYEVQKWKKRFSVDMQNLSRMSAEIDALV